MLILYSMVEEVIFWNILRIYGTLNNHLPTHGSSVYDLNQILEILLGLEAADKLGVIWGAEGHYKHYKLNEGNDSSFFFISVCTHFMELRQLTVNKQKIGLYSNDQLII